LEEEGLNCTLRLDGEDMVVSRLVMVAMHNLVVPDIHMKWELFAVAFVASSEVIAACMGFVALEFG